MSRKGYSERERHLELGSIFPGALEAPRQVHEPGEKEAISSDLCSRN
jgi:hypothetical protein